MNYLVLTPDGVGSTLLQRALTVYLNSAGLEYYNTHELLNGLTLKENNILIKDPGVGYSQSLEQIKNLLEKNSASLVSRIADYHVYARLEHRHEDYVNFYNFCNQYFNKILYCIRDPYEYALSWAIRNETKILNVYTVDERIKHHGVDKQCNIDLDFFQQKLLQYQNYQYWVADNFCNAIPIKYDDLNCDIDLSIKKIVNNANFNISDKFGVSLGDYSKILYKMSLKKQHLIDNIQVDKHLIKGVIELYRYQLKLKQDNKIIGQTPIKMNTLEDKRKKIINFDQTIDIYNNWVKNTNNFQKININDIDNKICQERLWYDSPNNSAKIL